MTAEFFEDDTTQGTMELSLERSQATLFGLSDCDSLNQSLAMGGGNAASWTLEDNSTDSELKCRLTSERQPIDSEDGAANGFSVVHEDGQFVVTMTGDDTMDAGMAEGLFPDNAFQFTLVFPGTVESVTGVNDDAYTIKDNTVTFTKITAIGSGAVVTAKDSPSSGIGGSVGLIIGIIVLIALIALIVYFVLKSKKNANPAPTADSAGPAPATPNPATGTPSAPHAGAADPAAPSPEHSFAPPTAQNPTAPEASAVPGTPEAPAPAEPRTPGAQAPLPEGFTGEETPSSQPAPGAPTDPAQGYVEPRAVREPGEEGSPSQG
ncbi:MAG: hypothetical protein Q4P36_03295 [Bowdeniella nasicola]|nr:hypothetical protein [Bowdeniella nasicola]